MPRNRSQTPHQASRRQHLRPKRHRDWVSLSVTRVRSTSVAPTGTLRLSLTRNTRPPHPSCEHSSHARQNPEAKESRCSARPSFQSSLLVCKAVGMRSSERLFVWVSSFGVRCGQCPAFAPSLSLVRRGIRAPPLWKRTRTEHFPWVSPACYPHGAKGYWRQGLLAPKSLGAKSSWHQWPPTPCGELNPRASSRVLPRG